MTMHWTSSWHSHSYCSGLWHAIKKRHENSKFRMKIKIWTHKWHYTSLRWAMGGLLQVFCKWIYNACNCAILPHLSVQWDLRVHKKSAIFANTTPSCSAWTLVYVVWKPLLLLLFLHLVMLVIHFMMTSSNGNIFHVTGPLCREFTGNAGNSLVIGEFPSERPVMQSFDVFFDLCLQTIVRLVIWDANVLIMTS